MWSFGKFQGEKYEPVELLNHLKMFKVLVVYMSGVMAGSLGTSLSDPGTYLAGASGGVYALIAAHLATLALNWQEDSQIRIKKVMSGNSLRTALIIFCIFRLSRSQSLR